MPKNLKKPTQAALDKLQTISENYNTPFKHYEIITQLDTLDADSVSYIISKAEEKNEYGRAINKLNSHMIRNINVGISEDPRKYKQYETRENVSGMNIEISWHRKMFTDALKENKMDVAAIHYLTLKNDLKDKLFTKACNDNKEELAKFFTYLDRLEEE